MNINKKIITSVALLGLLTACGDAVEVPPAHVGKILSPEGYRDKTVSPSKFRLQPCMAYCDKLILLETSDKPVLESMKLFMPKDQLNMSFDIRATVSVSNDDNNVNYIFDKVVGDRGIITNNTIYKTYAKQKFRSVSRSVMASYSINEIASNRSLVEAELFRRLKEELSSTPITITQLGLANVQFPEVIVKAKELAKEREVAIETARADKLVSIEKAEAALEIAKKDRLVRIEKAKTIQQENRITANSVTDKYLKYRQLEVLELIAKSGNAVYMPLDTSLVLVGGDNKNVLPIKKR